ncbi:PE-PPE domain-containing protein [Nocardia sp. NEAU-G5]|uniref:PE-PPE domain-containing protein n=1 Tax=Nocardia albiluteola TaxID=2842303 RepID=A0ABS6AYM0_9NOCA|nr:cutinase family protein [Nocardia albiluteola]MBU3063099.1 PE-PPE domain-containing protein [Nocardia albiluteola]
MSRGKFGGVLGSAALVAAALGVGTGTAAADTGAGPLPEGCRALVVIGIQGTGQSSPDPQADTGMLGSILGPLAHDNDMAQVFIPYPASFGSVPGTPPGPTFAASALQAQTRLDVTAADVAAQCPTSRIAVVGYSQGAGAATDFARREGAGTGPVPSDRIAGIAAISDWTRPPGPNAVPGRPGQQSPDPVPGTSGTSTKSVRLAPVPADGGIASNPQDFGTVNGRVVEICADGDLACNAPDNADAVKFAAGVAAHTDFRDPITAVTSAGAAVSGALSTATTQTLLDDVNVQGGQVDYLPGRSISDRVAQAAVSPDPAPPAQQAQAAAAKMQQVIGAVVADPIGQLPHLAAQLAAAIGPNLAANAADGTALVRLAGSIGPHDSYTANPQVTQWMSALAHDAVGGRR